MPAQPRINRWNLMLGLASILLFTVPACDNSRRSGGDDDDDDSANPGDDDDSGGTADDDDSGGTADDDDASGPCDNLQSTGTEVGDVAEDFTVTTDADGTTSFSLHDHCEELVVLHFDALWALKSAYPSIAVTERMGQLHDAYSASGLSVLSVWVDGLGAAEEASWEMLEELPFAWDQAIDVDDALFDLYGEGVVPLVIVFEPGAVINQIIPGFTEKTFPDNSYFEALLPQN